MSDPAARAFVDRLHDSAFDIPSWLYGAMRLNDPVNDRRLGPWFDFLVREAPGIDGDIAEFGVFQGASLITAALLCARLGVPKRLHGFDTFSGFPPLHANDKVERFAELHAAGEISDAHYEAVRLFHQAEAAGLHKRHSFDATSLQFVEERIRAFGLDNITLHTGEFKDTVAAARGVRYAGILLDCDLYESYRDVLPHCWESLAPGGLIYLDEYYALKYPGPRIAMHEFCATIGVWPERVLAYSWPGEFERWYLRKPR